LGNKIGALVCRIPAEGGISSEDRLQQVHSRMSFLKQTPAAFLSFLVAKTFGTLGSLGGLTPWLFSKAHGNASAVLSNVRGPDQCTHLGGRRVETTLGFMPLPPGIPLGVVVTSYAGNITLTVAAEPWAVPDADMFLSWVVEEYKSLLEQANKK
jgi:diacylglycerol O-acyltransferase